MCFFGIETSPFVTDICTNHVQIQNKEELIVEKDPQTHENKSYLEIVQKAVTETYIKKVQQKHATSEKQKNARYNRTKKASNNKTKSEKAELKDTKQTKKSEEESQEQTEPKDVKNEEINQGEKPSKNQERLMLAWRDLETLIGPVFHIKTLQKMLDLKGKAKITSTKLVRTDKISSLSLEDLIFEFVEYLKNTGKYGEIYQMTKKSQDPQIEKAKVESICKQLNLLEPSKGKACLESCSVVAKILTYAQEEMIKDKIRNIREAIKQMLGTINIEEDDQYIKLKESIVMNVRSLDSRFNVLPEYTLEGLSNDLQELQQKLNQKRKNKEENTKKANLIERVLDDLKEFETKIESSMDKTEKVVRNLFKQMIEEKFGKDDYKILIYIEPCGECRCSRCHEAFAKLHNDKRVERKWRFVDILGIKTYFVSTMHMGKCKKCKVRCVQEVSWAKPKSKVTIYFARQVALQALRKNVLQAAKEERCTCETVENCLKTVQEEYETSSNDRMKGVYAIGIDETSYKIGKKYVTVVCDLVTKRIIWMHDKHGLDIIKLFFKSLSDEEKNGIQFVAGDAASWIDSAVKEYVPHATRCLDTFHIINWFSKRIQEICIELTKPLTKQLRKLQVDRRSQKSKKKSDEEKELEKEIRQIKNWKWVLLSGREKLTAVQHKQLKEMKDSSNKQYKELWTVYELKEKFRTGFKERTGEEEIDRQHGKQMIKNFVEEAVKSSFSKMQELVAKVEEYKESIINTVVYGWTSGIVEALNGKCKRGIRRARGFSDAEHFIKRAMFECGRFCIKLLNRNEEFIS